MLNYLNRKFRNFTATLSEIKLLDSIIQGQRVLQTEDVPIEFVCRFTSIDEDAAKEGVKELAQSLRAAGLGSCYIWQRDDNKTVITTIIDSKLQIELTKEPIDCDGSGDQPAVSPVAKQHRQPGPSPHPRRGQTVTRQPNPRWI